MPQNEYWEKRFTLLNEMLLQKSDDYIKHAQLSYAAVMASIEKDINDFYMRFAQENNITFQETKQLLTSEQRQRFQMELKDYIAQGQQANLSPEWLHILENASTVHRITKLQAIQFQLRQQVELLEAKKVSEITSLLKNIFQENYYRTAYEIQRGTGVGSAFSKISTKHIEKVLAKPWAPDGKNFSERIWGQDRTNLVYQLETRFTQGVIRGDAPQRIIADMKKSLNSSQYATKRLVLTESAFISATSRKESLEMLGVEEYKVIATLEINTCEVCRALDGKVFLLKDFKIGTNAHPFHPGCRCDEVPKIDEKYTKNHQRAARGKDGKTYYVPVDMTYPEWYKTYVESDPDWLLQEKKHKNKNSDRKQYEEYKAIFGKKEVGSFDYFQNMKYTNNDSWNTLKTKMRELDNKPYDIRINENATAQEVEKEIKLVKETLAEMPKKVKRALKNGTIIDIGQEGKSQYDYNKDVMYIAKGADIQQVRHETGHMVDNKLMNQQKVESLKREILGEITDKDICIDNETFIDNLGNPVEVYFIQNKALISEYQGRIYHCEGIIDAFDFYSGDFRYDRLWDFISEPYELYIRDKKELQKKCPKLYDYIKEVIE